MTRSLRRRTRQMLQRIEYLEQRVADLEARLDSQQARNQIRRRLPSALPAPPPEGSRFSRPAPAGYTGARVVARHMLQAGKSKDEITAHLEATFDLDDAASVVEEVALYDSGLSEPNREGT
jgi:hypothetical protein